jgi:hypothetical protein
VASLGGGFWCVVSDGSLVCVLGGVFGVVCVLGGVFGVVCVLGGVFRCCARVGAVVLCLLWWCVFRVVELEQWAGERACNSLLACIHLFQLGSFIEHQLL